MEGHGWQIELLLEAPFIHEGPVAVGGSLHENHLRLTLSMYTLVFILVMFRFLFEAVTYPVRWLLEWPARRRKVRLVQSLIAAGVIRLRKR